MRATFTPLPFCRRFLRRASARLLALQLMKMDLSIIALIGIILLIGIVKKNAILMIDFAVQTEREEQKPPDDAIYKACLLRFRPIMMTTMAAMFGALPLALGTGVGCGTSPPSGYHDRWRPDSQPDAHAVYNASRLHLHGSPAVRWLRRAFRRQPAADPRPCTL